MVTVHKEPLSLPIRRSRPIIYYEILLAIRELWANKGEARITPVQSQVNIPTKRFREFLHQMERSGLIRLNPLDVTAAGNEYVEEMERFLKFLEKYGLVPKHSVARFAQRTPPRPHWAEIISEYEKKLKTTA